MINARLLMLFDRGSLMHAFIGDDGATIVIDPRAAIYPSTRFIICTVER